MKVSVIIPIYKAELYLKDCVCNLQRQSYKDIEIILVDDGSPDNSGKIADSLAETDSRIAVIHKNNGGASDARNAGVDVAVGDYLLFVDADDFLKDDESLNSLVQEVGKKDFPDVLGFNIMYYYPSMQTFVCWPEYKEQIVAAKNKETLIQELVKTGTLPVSSYGKLINRAFYVRSDIRFMKGTIGEDIPWTIELFEKAKSVSYINEYYYCYRQEVATSVTNTFHQKNFLDLVRIIKTLVTSIPELRFEQETKDALYSFVAYELCIALSGVYRLDKELRNQTREDLRKLRWLLKYRTNPKVRKAALANTLFGFHGMELLLRFYKTQCRK